MQNVEWQKLGQRERERESGSERERKCRRGKSAPQIYALKLFTCDLRRIHRKECKGKREIYGKNAGIRRVMED